MKKSQRLLALLLTLFALTGALSGCMRPENEESEPPLPDISKLPDNQDSFAEDNVFSLNCNKEYSFNPITSSNANNVLCTQLMYDNVYDVDSSFEVTSNIVLSSRSEDYVHWYFTIDTSVQFWDGSTLTAYDVAYSIQRAQQSARLKSRLASIYGVGALNDEELAVTMSNYVANTQLPALLTIPVIKNGSVEEKVPLGTGAYQPNEELTKLTLFTEHKNAASMPLDTVYLVEILETDASISAFESSKIDLVANDPSGVLNLGYGSANDVRYYATTNMHYIGFNGNSRFFSNELCRNAMTYVINRERIVNDIMGGAAIEAALPMNPASELYNDNYSDIISYSVKKSMEAFDLAQVMDYDDDGFREIMIMGTPVESNIVFIVPSDNAQKVAAAQSITDNLKDLGIKVVLKTLSWNDYITALAEGEFDMYYAEVMMTADFNPSKILLKDGSLNYGKFSDSNLAEKISDYLSAPDEDRKRAADYMNKHITDTAPIVTICFERHQVITHRGVVSGIKPSQYNIFQNMHEWTVDLG